MLCALLSWWCVLWWSVLQPDDFSWRNNKIKMFHSSQFLNILYQSIWLTKWVSFLFLVLVTMLQINCLYRWHIPLCQYILMYYFAFEFTQSFRKILSSFKFLFNFVLTLYCLSFCLFIFWSWICLSFLTFNF